MSSVIIDSSPVSTPAHEWAQETTSALSTRVLIPSYRVASESNATTPSKELPGSFPREYGGKDPKDALEPIVANIPSIDTAREEVVKMLGNVGESVKNYLPESVSRVIPIGSASETQEKEIDAPLDPTSTAKPSDVESDVSGAPLGGSARAAVGATAAVSGVATALNLDPTSENKPETGANNHTEPAISGVATTLHLDPTSDGKSEEEANGPTKPAVSGVATAPNLYPASDDKTETGANGLSKPALNLYPTSDNKSGTGAIDRIRDPQVNATDENLEDFQRDEKLEETVDNTEHPLAGDEAYKEHISHVANDPPVSATNEKLSKLGSKEKQVDEAVDSRSPGLIRYDSVAPTPPPKDDSEVSGVEKHDQPFVKSTPTQQHVLGPDETKANVVHEPNDSGSKLTESFDNSPDIHTRSSPELNGSSSATDAHRKPKFMDKVKGEMKIFSGKIGRNPEKVEEGKKMKGSTA